MTEKFCKVSNIHRNNRPVLCFREKRWYTLCFHNLFLHWQENHSSNYEINQYKRNHNSQLLRLVTINNTNASRTVLRAEVDMVVLEWHGRSQNKNVLQFFRDVWIRTAWYPDHMCSSLWKQAVLDVLSLRRYRLPLSWLGLPEKQKPMGFMSSQAQIERKVILKSEFWSCTAQCAE